MNSLRQHFGLANASVVDSIVVEWPSGYTQVLTAQNPNQNMTITEEIKTHVHGVVFHDLNGNCIQDAGENAISGQRVMITPGNIQTTVDANGQYDLWINYGSYSITAVDAGVWTTPCANQNFTGSAINNDITINLAMSASSGNPDLAISGGSTAWRRGFANTTTIDVINLAAGTANNVAIKVVYPEGLYPIGANKDYFVSPNGSWIFPVAEMATGGSYTITLQDSVGLENVIGDILAINATVFLDEEDLNMNNNDLTISQEVVGAVDPNDILVSPRGEGSEGYISKTQALTYTVRFQNIGNYEATRVRVVCEIPEELGLSGIETIAMSHNGQMMIEGNKLIWTMNNIGLPTSAENEPASHGFIVFRGTPSSFVQYKDRVNVNAEIVLDFEDGIRTNTVTNTIQQDGQQARFVVCYPNPAAEKVMVSLNNNMPQYSKKEKIVSVRITDQMGQVVLASKTLNVMDAQIDVSALETGVYLVVVKNELGIETTGRLVKID